MRRVWLSVLGIALALAPAAGKADEKTTAVVTGAVVRLFEPEQLVELKVEDADPAAPGLGRGRIVFLDVSHARILDARGRELDRAHRRAWYVKDEGWARLRLGGALRAVVGAATMHTPPGDLPEGARSGGDLLVRPARRVEILRER